MLFSKIIKIRKNLTSLFEPILLDKKTSLKVLMQGLTSTVLAVIIPLIFVPKIVSSIQESHIEKAFSQSTMAIIIFLGIFIVRTLFMYSWYWASLGLFEAAIHKKYMPEVMMINSSSFDKKGTGYTLSKYVSGVKAMAQIARTILTSIPSVLVVLGISIYLAFDANIYIGFALCIFIIIAILTIVLIFTIETKMIYPSIDIQNNVSGDIARVIMSKNEVIYSDKVQFELKKIVKKIFEIFAIESKAYKFSVRTSDSIWLFPYFSLLVLFFVYTAGYITLSFSDFTLIILLASSINNAVELVFHVFGSIFDNSRNVTAFYELISEEKMIGYEEGKTFSHKNGTVEIKSVSFSYGDETSTVLNNFNLRISGGTKLALVGKSGSGKTTIAKLITGYMRPTAGDIIIDNQNLKEIALKTYYKHVGYLTQEPMVFDGTIRENLLYGVDREINSDEITEVLKKAQCDFVFETKTGLETEIGEKGIRLSGGERQRLAIAKLLLKNPEIVVLDEPTSALDSFSEDAIARALDELFKDRTVIIIAHRLQTVKRADKILVLEKGEIIEEGNHKELIERAGEYSKMLEMQSGF